MRLWVLAPVCRAFSCRVRCRRSLRRRRALPSLHWWQGCGRPSAWEGFVVFGDGYRLVARDVLRAEERGTSSTLRETIGSARSMLALLPEVVSELRRRGWPPSLLIITDNQTLAGSLEAGAKSPGIQSMVVRIFKLLMWSGVQFVSRWAPRSSSPMVFADDGSKLESLQDTCDFKLRPEVFELAQRVFGVRHSWDRFASSVNRQGGAGVRFSSLHFCPGASVVDAFAVGWGGVGVDNWLFPPFALVGRVLRHLFECRGRGTIVVPWVSRAPWWPFVRRRSPGVVSAPSGLRRIELPRRDGLLLRAGSIPLSAKEQRFPSSSCGWTFRPFRWVRRVRRERAGAGGSERVRHWKSVSFLVVSGAPLWLFLVAPVVCPSAFVVAGVLGFS